MYKIEIKDYYSKIYDPNYKQKLKIFLDGKEIDTKYLKNLNLIDECFSDDFFVLGSVCIGQIDITLGKEALDDISSFSEFYFESILEIENGTITIPIGYYYAHPNDIDTSDEYTIKFTLYDKLYDMDQDGLDFSQEVANGNFTRFDLVNLICQKYDLELATPNFLNKDKVIGVYDNEITPKGWLSFISERAGGYAKIIRGKKLYIKSYGEVDKVNIPSATKGSTKNGDLKTITGVSYQNGVQDFTKGDDTGLVVRLSQDNYFSCDEDEVQKIYDSLVGLSFQSLSIRIWGDPSIDTGDIIQVGDYITFCQKDWTWGNGFYGYYKTIVNEVKSNLDLQKISTSRKLRKISSQINEVEGSLKINASEIAETQKQIEEIRNPIQEIQSDNHLCIYDAAEENAIEYKIYGKCEQESEPSPDNPSEIKTIKGTTNLYNKENADIRSGAYYNGTNGAFNTGGTSSVDLNYTSIKPNTIYTISCQNFGRVVFYDNNKNYISNVANLYTFTSPSNAYYIRFQALTETFDINKIQLEEGSIAHSYVPHGSWLKIKITGKNKINKEDYQKGYCFINSTLTANANWGVFWIACRKDVTYTLSGLKAYGNVKIVQTDKNKNIISILASRVYEKREYTLKATQDGFFGISFVWSENTTLGSELDTIQLEESDVATDYEAYKEKEILIDLQEKELCSVGDIRDELNVTTGELIKRIKKIDSYNNEKISTNYISTTGSLDAGSTIYYVVVEEMIVKLSQIDISLYRNENHIDLFSNIDTNTSMKYLVNTPYNEIFYKKSEAQAEFEILNNSITNSVSEVNTTIKNNQMSINEKLNDYATNENVSQQISSVENKITSSEEKITIIKETLENGISQVRTEKGYTFNDQGLLIDDDNSKAKNLLNEVGMTIIDKSTNSVLLFAGYDEETQESIVKSKNMIVEKYLVVPNCRFESYQNPNRGKGTGVFDL